MCESAWIDEHASIPGHCVLLNCKLSMANDTNEHQKRHGKRGNTECDANVCHSHFQQENSIKCLHTTLHSHSVCFCFIEKQSRCCFTFDLMLFLWTVTSHTKNPQKVNSINSNMDNRPRLHEKKDVRLLCEMKRERESVVVGVGEGYERHSKSGNEKAVVC